ncbi:unnamed protein product [Arctia plantaginis]|uniref:Uncharacterized protein n=1 Tax=Arctia plantaginis TaxID=874455 RepID=A0A8S1AP14_ARCPL|nr:unnamed protein product [Arctia plantaginis]
MRTYVLTKDDFREISREELTLMRSVLGQELHQTLKQMLVTELQSIRHEITILENSVEFLDENYESTKSAITTYQERLCRLQKENAQLTTTLQDLQIRLQVMEQHNRSKNFEIQCVPDSRT